MNKQLKIFFVLLLVIINGFTLYIYQDKNDHRLLVAFLDVGQGDAIFIRTPNGKQMLVDGGPPGGAVLRELGKVMPFYDRSIDVVLATHPDQDHIGGLPEILNRFSVGLFVRTRTTSTTAVFETLLAVLETKKIKQEIITRPENIYFGDGSEFDILFPDQDTSGWETNESSIVGRMIYGQNSFLLTGDSPYKIERYLVKRYGPLLKSDVLKAGHHGSKYSTSRLYLKYVLPSHVVISAGLNNRYGHPSVDVVNNLLDLGVKIEQTLGQGMIVFNSDGKVLNLRP